MLAQNPKDASTLPIDRRAGLLAPVADDTCLVFERDAKIDPLAQVPLELGEEVTRRLCVVPDMGAGARAAADPFPRPEAPTAKAMEGRGGERTHVGDGPLQKPVRQGGVVIKSSAPELCLAREPLFPTTLEEFKKDQAWLDAKTAKPN